MRLNNLHFDMETVESLDEYLKADCEFTLQALAEMEAEVQERQHTTDLNLEFLDKLEISYGFHDGPCVSLEELVGLLKDEKRLKKIVSMLKNKAFW